jgi:hypothetical protein
MNNNVTPELERLRKRIGYVFQAKCTNCFGYLEMRYPVPGTTHPRGPRKRGATHGWKLACWKMGAQRGRFATYEQSDNECALLKEFV